MRCIIIVICALLCVACDTGYIIKGTIAQASRRPESAPVRGWIADSSAAVLPGVDVTVYGKDRERLPVTLSRTRSDSSGRYYQYFLGPPSGLSRYDFLEFSKSGYETKTVNFVNPSAGDPSVEVRSCRSEEKEKPCWVVNVIMRPVQKP